MWLLFLPLLLVFGFLFAVGGLAAILFGLLEGPGQLLLIGLGLWLIWHNASGHRHERHGRQAAAGTPWRSARVTVADERAERGHKADQKRPRISRYADLPSDMRFKVEGIERKIEVLLAQADRFPPFSQDLYLVRQTSSDYLPRTLNAYLAMSRRGRDGLLTSTSSTAHEELNAQLDLLDSKLDDIGRDLQRQETDRLLANRRFLEDRFGMRDTPSGPIEPSAPTAEVA